MSTVRLYGAKGGVGTSTVAALIALQLRDEGHEVWLTSDNMGDLRAILGEFGESDDAIVFGGAGSPVVVVDHGTTPPGRADPADQVFLVIRGCFLAFRRALAQPCRPNGIIFLEEQGRSLGTRDVEDVLGVRVVATIAVEPRVARLVDAGLLGKRHSSLHLRLPVTV